MTNRKESSVKKALFRKKSKRFSCISLPKPELYIKHLSSKYVNSCLKDNVKYYLSKYDNVEYKNGLSSVLDYLKDNTYGDQYILGTVYRIKNNMCDVQIGVSGKMEKCDRQSLKNTAIRELEEEASLQVISEDSVISIDNGCSFLTNICNCTHNSDREYYPSSNTYNRGPKGFMFVHGTLNKFKSILEERQINKKHYHDTIDRIAIIPANSIKIFEDNIIVDVLPRLPWNLRV